MASLSIRNLSDETHRALRLRAAQHGRSTESEIRFILEEAVRPKVSVKIGAELATFKKRLAGLDFKPVRDKKLAEPAIFE